MKSALKIQFLIVFLAVVCSVQAQITYHLEVGFNNPFRTGTGVSTSYLSGNPTPSDILNAQVGNISTTYLAGVRVGVTGEYDLKNQFSLLSGVLYNLVYSNKIQIYPNSVQTTSFSYGQFLDVPIHLTYTYPFSNSLKAFVFAGPTVNIGLYQSLLNQSTVGYIPSKYSDLYKDAIYNRINLQMGGGAGVQWKKYQIKAGYDYGLNNMNRLGTGMIHQNGWYLTLGLNF